MNWYGEFYKILALWTSMLSLFSSCSQNQTFSLVCRQPLPYRSAASPRQQVPDDCLWRRQRSSDSGDVTCGAAAPFPSPEVCVLRSVEDNIRWDCWCWKCWCWDLALWWWIMFCHAAADCATTQHNHPSIIHPSRLHQTSSPLRVSSLLIALQWNHHNVVVAEILSLWLFSICSQSVPLSPLSLRLICACLLRARTHPPSGCDASFLTRLQRQQQQQSDLLPRRCYGRWPIGRPLNFISEALLSRKKVLQDAESFSNILTVVVVRGRIPGMLQLRDASWHFAPNQGPTCEVVI